MVAVFVKFLRNFFLATIFYAKNFRSKSQFFSPIYLLALRNSYIHCTYYITGPTPTIYRIPSSGVHRTCILLVLILDNIKILCIDPRKMNNAGVTLEKGYFYYISVFFALYTKTISFLILYIY